VPIFGEARRASALYTRPLTLQWVQGSPEVAETSFFKINSQGTPLDDTEEMLIRNRKKPIAICARAVLRSGTGHKYWSMFSDENQKWIEELACNLYDLLFEPEIKAPVKTLDIPLGGSVSPVEALSLLVGSAPTTHHWRHLGLNSAPAMRRRALRRLLPSRIR